MHAVTSECVSAATLQSLEFLWLEITERCNLTCSHCYADSAPQRDLYSAMGEENWQHVIAEASEMGCRSLQFIGGEPTLHPSLATLIEFAHEHQFELVEVYTNATRISDNLLGCFQRNAVSIATSFYSDDPDVHEQITNGVGSWRRTVNGIRTVLDAGLSLRVGIIETDVNPGHGARATEFLKGLGVKRIGFDRNREVGRGALTQIGTKEERFDELCGQCWKGRLCVTASGSAYPCVFSRATPLGDARDGLRAIVAGTRLRRFREKVRQLEHDRRNEITACNPNTQCSPHNCNPTLPCSPQGPTCSPDSVCGPNTTCQPDNR